MRARLIVPRRMMILLTRTMTAVIMRLVSPLIRSTPTSQEEILEKMNLWREFYTPMTVMSCSCRLAVLFQVRTKLFGCLKFLL